MDYVFSFIGIWILSNTGSGCDMNHYSSWMSVILVTLILVLVKHYRTFVWETKVLVERFCEWLIADTPVGYVNFTRVSVYDVYDALHVWFNDACELRIPKVTSNVFNRASIT